jgi:hypothetical protein
MDEETSEKVHLTQQYQLSLAMQDASNAPRAESIKRLAAEIMARIKAGETALAQADLFRQQADDRFVSAGRLLIEVRSRLANTREFKEFLRDHCAGLSQSRAYEYMNMAKGRTTADETRANANERKRRHRQKTKACDLRSSGRGTEKTAVGAGSVDASAEAEMSASRTAHPVSAMSPSDTIAEVKRVIDCSFPLIGDAGRCEIKKYVAGWSLNKSPKLGA